MLNNVNIVQFGTGLTKREPKLDQKVYNREKES